MAIRRLMAAYAEAEDMIEVGAYVKGSNPAVDEAIKRKPAIDAFLMQDIDERAPIDASLAALAGLAGIEIPPEEAGYVAGGET
jgi:flagellum-specific ATP synthase